MIEDMTIRNLSQATQQAYIYSVRKFSRHFGKSPARLGVEESSWGPAPRVASTHCANDFVGAASSRTTGDQMPRGWGVVGDAKWSFRLR
jgi:hypothetical protein